MTLVNKAIKNRVGFVILNRPEKRNALSPALVDELYSTISSFLENDAVKVIVLKSSDKAFCAGADLDYLKQLRHFSPEENLADSQKLRSLFDLIHAGDKIFISQVEGPALAGGCGLATICDFCFATPSATFGYTESRIGFVPALVMVYLQHRISGAHLRDLVLTGKIISSEEAANIQLVNRICDENTIASEVELFAENLCNQVSGQSVAFIKAMLRKLPSMSFSESLDYAAETNVKARSSEDCIKGIDSFLNKEKIGW